MGDSNNGSGTVRHERPSPAYVFHQSVAERGPAASEILRNQRLRDLIAAVEEFWRASGPDRTYWRRDARHRLAEWRTRYRNPEHAAFQQAVAQHKEAAP